MVDLAVNQDAADALRDAEQWVRREMQRVRDTGLPHRWAKLIVLRDVADELAARAEAAERSE